jgi:hypothetical protein
MLARSICHAAFIAFAGCGTLVQVVDEHETPVAAARVLLMYPSFSGPETTTDSRGYARLGDSWFSRPFFSMDPGWVEVSTESGRWTFDYPPLPLLRLDPAGIEPHHQEASQHSLGPGCQEKER